jgi:putative inorganic carbon (HCO3(-)) transporter
MRMSDWITQHELWFLGLAVPFLLFPMGVLPLVGLFLIGLTWISRRLARGHFTIQTGVEIPSLILIFMALVGYWISVDPALSKARFWNILLDLAVFYGLANALRPVKQVRWIVGGLIAVALGVMLLSFLGTDWNLVRIFDLPWLYDRLPTLIRGLPGSGIAMGGNDLINPRWVGITLGALVPVLLAFTFTVKAGPLRLLCAVAAVLGTGLLLLTQAVQGLLGLCAGVFFLLVWRSRWWLLLLLPAAGILIGGYFLIGPGQVGGVLFSQDNPVGVAVVLRLDIWSRALAMIRDMPFTGIGLNTFPLIQWHFYPGHLLGPEPHAHNIYLQTALDMGLPGLAAFVWFFIAWGLRVWRNAQRQAAPEYKLLLAGLAAGAIAYLAHGFIDAMMMGAKPSVIVWGLMGIAAAAPAGHPVQASHPAAQAASPLRTTRFFIRIAPLLLLIGASLASLLLKPESLVMNLAAIQAHWGLYPAQTGGAPLDTHLEIAKDRLLQVQAVDPGNLSAYELLGRIYAWEGNPAAAMLAFAYRVALDGQDALLRYYPSGSWLRGMQGGEQVKGDDWADLIKIYSQWMARFPERAAPYAEIGLIWQCYQDDPARATRVVGAGIEKGAVPPGLLEYYQSLLARGDNSLCVQK